MDGSGGPWALAIAWFLSEGREVRERPEEPHGGRSCCLGPGGQGEHRWVNRACDVSEDTLPGVTSQPLPTLLSPEAANKPDVTG